MECTLENNQEMSQGTCVTVTEEKWNSSIQKKKWNRNEKLLWYSTQHNCVNNDSKEVKVECPLWNKSKTLQESCVTVIPGEKGQSYRENLRKTIKKCVSHYVITKMGCQWPKRKQPNDGEPLKGPCVTAKQEAWDSLFH